MPTGAAVVVWRRGPGGREFLVLRRSHRPPEHGGDWDWTPPTGVREAGESDEEGARRELLEETGLALDLRPTPCGFSGDWPVYAAEAPADAPVRLDPEHDRFEWLPLAEAIARCRPQLIADQIACVAAWLDRYDSEQPGQL